MVHDYIGCEPSGISFNALKLDKSGCPHNPLINSGAIMACSLIKADPDNESKPGDKLISGTRFSRVLNIW